MSYKIGRNDPCPCGSGKKYKKCCGATSSSTKIAYQREPDYFMINKEIAYKGRIGQQRKDFCINFIERKKKRIKELTTEQLKAAEARDESISCHRGCCYCCSAYVEATLQECEVIVYYLYQNNQVLNSFLRTYPEWRAQVKKGGDLFKSCGRFWKEEVTPRTAKQLLQEVVEEEKRYLEQNIPCPFLDNQLCSIYEVRPYMCVSLVAVTPSEWCNPSNENEPFRYKAYPKEVMSDYSFYYRNLDRFVISFMPMVVYEILKSGTYYYGSGGVPNLEKLDYEFLKDPEVTAILRKHGVLNK